jgi:RNA polymerase sigma-70 factor (ECF subfamily)
MTEQERPFSVQVERSIAERAAGGDSSAVAELYDGYERQLHGYCHRICRNPEDAADATQDAFCSVIQRLPGLDTASLNFAAYLFTTARNACMDIIKQRGRAEPTDEVPEDPLATAAIDTDPERQLLTGDQQRAAREASDRLPETQRTVLALREVSELSYDEIAETMGMKPNAVAQLISRARLNFYKQLRTGAVVIPPLDDAAQRAIELTVQRQDGKINSDDLDWLQAHLKENESSRINAEAIQESAALYRAIAPVVVIAGLRTETLQRAIESIGADPKTESSGGDVGSSSGVSGVSGTAASAGASVGATLGAKPDQASAHSQPSIGEAGDRRRDQRRAAGALAVLIAIVLLGGAAESDEVSPAASAATVEAPTAQTSAAKNGGEPRKGSNDKPVSSKSSAAPPTTTQNSQADGDMPVKSGGNPSNGPEKKNSGGQKTTSGGQSETPPAEDPAPQTTTPPTDPPSSTPPPPPPPKKPPVGPIDFCSTNCNPPPPVP